MEKYITKNEYVLTNMHLPYGYYCIRLKDNEEYDVYYNTKGKKRYYIKKDNEKYYLDDDTRKAFLSTIRVYEKYGI